MSKDIKKALEHCAEWDCDNCPNREELGSGEIICRGRLLPEVLEYVTDLETKLAESEKKASKKNDESWDLYLSLKQFYSRLGVEVYADDEIQDVAVKELNRLLNENEELKQQLAEKDKQIKTILKENEELVIKHSVYSWGDKIQQDKVYSITGETLDLLINRQNKKVIEQLEKVKLWCQGNTIQCFYNEAETEIKEKHIVVDRPQENGSLSLIKYIDNQIKQLKGE